MKVYDLIIFDIDGTLADRDTSELLPGVATNQGGVACRLAGWGDQYPTEMEAMAHIYKVAAALNHRPNSIQYSFAYQKKDGSWIDPIEFGYTDSLVPWYTRNRKPNSGMLIDAVVYANLYSTSPPRDNILMVGDRSEDEEAAKNAECDFMWADAFFGRTGDGDGNDN